jgi:hypothetical protein
MTITALKSKTRRVWKPVVVTYEDFIAYLAQELRLFGKLPPVGDIAVNLFKVCCIEARSTVMTRKVDAMYDRMQAEGYVTGEGIISARRHLTTAGFELFEQLGVRFR